MSLLRSLLWLSIFLGATFAFAVLFEHGPTNFQENARKNFDQLQAYLTEVSGAKKPAPKTDKG